MERHVVKARLLFAQRGFGQFALGNIGANSAYAKGIVFFIAQRKFHQQVSVLGAIFVHQIQLNLVGLLGLFGG